MELLLSAVKDAASGRTPASDVADVEALIDHLRLTSPSPTRSAVVSPRGGSYGAPVAAAAAAAAVGVRSMELEAVRRKLEEDNQRLRSELLAARKVLSERLKH